jgi:NAD(P)-dependent dehydrogenase (short-subunit alcohol dehydrogenase family)
MTQAFFDISGATALITGAGRGLGAALASGFAASGARVALADINLANAQATVAQIQSQGGQAHAYGCDISQASQVRALFDAVQHDLGQLDILVNNAGINIPKPAEELQLEEWQRIIGVNLTGTFLCCQTGGALMLARGAGCIINICSVHGHVGSYVHKAVAYNAAKAGVINMTRSLALEWGERGVRVNGISPGPLATELMATRLADAEYVRKNMERLALKRVGAPSDVVGAAVFLASPAANWVSGHILAVDGGWLAA